jgi:hypothetical protein
VPVDPSRRLVRTTLRSRWKAIAFLLVVETMAFVATAAAGSPPSDPTPVPESAFQRVVVPPLPAADVPAAPRVGDRRVEPGRPSALSELEELREPLVATAPPERAQPDVEPADPVVVNVPPPPPPAPKFTHTLRGYASYYCRAGSSPCTVNYPDTGGIQAYAAAGPDLRAALGSGWRGSIVYVDGIRVKLIDWCQCYSGESNEKLLDLYYDVFKRTGSPVVIRW